MSERILKQYIRTVLLEGVSLREAKWEGKSGQQLLDMLDSYGNATWVFFDTETTGMHPKNDQLTEIAAIAIKPNGWSGSPTDAGQFNEKVTLTDQSLERMNDPESPERKRWEKDNQKTWRPLKEPQDLLKLTRYGEKGRKYITEEDCLKQFMAYVDGLGGDVVLCAQNAAFDMRMISGRGKKYGLQMKQYPVIDTLKLLQLHLMPLMRTLRKEDEEAEAFLDKTRTKGARGGFYYSSSLGKVADAFNISIDEWHNAYADVKMMMGVMAEMHAFISKHADVDYKTRHDKEASYQRRRKRR